MLRKQIMKFLDLISNISKKSQESRSFFLKFTEYIGLPLPSLQGFSSKYSNKIIILKYNQLACFTRKILDVVTEEVVDKNILDLKENIKYTLIFKIHVNHENRVWLSVIEKRNLFEEMPKICFH